MLAKKSLCVLAKSILCVQNILTVIKKLEHKSHRLLLYVQTVAVVPKIPSMTTCTKPVRAITVTSRIGSTVVLFEANYLVQERDYVT